MDHSFKSTERMLISTLLVAYHFLVPQLTWMLLFLSCFSSPRFLLLVFIPILFERWPSPYTARSSYGILCAIACRRGVKIECFGVGGGDWGQLSTNSCFNDCNDRNKTNCDMKQEAGNGHDGSNDKFCQEESRIGGGRRTIWGFHPHNKVR